MSTGASGSVSGVGSVVASGLASSVGAAVSPPSPDFSSVSAATRSSPEGSGYTLALKESIDL